jgi:hypothetical protein
MDAVLMLMTKLKGISAFTNEDIGFLKEYQDVMFYLAETESRVRSMPV